MEWKRMERCHFFGSEESLGHLVEGKTCSNPLDINTDLSTLSDSDQRQLMGMRQIKLDLLRGMTGREFRFTVRTLCKLQRSSRIVYILGQNRSQCNMRRRIASPVGFKFKFRCPVLLYRRQEIFEVVPRATFIVGLN